MTTVAAECNVARSADSLAPATPVTPRLVPARIGRPGRVQTVHVPCPAWCVLDHLDERQVAVEDISHRGAPDHAQVSTMTDDFYSAFEVYTQVYSDPANEDPRMRVAAIVVTDGSRDAYQTPDMADETADELIAFAMRLKEAAGIARLANQTAA
ncbi:DUF6907 domain-containing protein [Streptomyces canus]|uniref:DUF6907 domain-containing protein n=1 Tax=Streptomyces canus TaxID=58343 RepID=UPI00278B60FD|nr:hypothetical protein [Streptomyces canus]